MKKLILLILFLTSFSFAQYPGYGAGASRAWIQGQISDSLEATFETQSYLYTTFGRLHVTGYGAMNQARVRITASATNYFHFPAIPQGFLAKSVTIDSLIIYAVSDQATTDSINGVAIRSSDYTTLNVLWSDTDKHLLPNTNSVFTYAPDLALSTTLPHVISVGTIRTSGNMDFYTLKLVYTLTY